MANSTLEPHPPPPIPTALDKIPVDKLKLPTGFKARSGRSLPCRRAHAVVLKDKGTVFMGTAQSAASMPLPRRTANATSSRPVAGADQPNGLVIKDGALYVLAINQVCATTTSRTSSTIWET